MGVVALSLATIGCGSEQKTQSKETTPAAVRNINLKKYTVAEDAELDTLSYTVGANLGLQMRFRIADFNLNHDLYLKYMIEFFENGDRKDPALLEGQQKLTQFNYTQYMPYMRAKRCVRPSLPIVPIHSPCLSSTMRSSPRRP